MTINPLSATIDQAFARFKLPARAPRACAICAATSQSDSLVFTDDGCCVPCARERELEARKRRAAAATARALEQIPAMLRWASFVDLPLLATRSKLPEKTVAGLAKHGAALVAQMHAAAAQQQPAAIILIKGAPGRGKSSLAVAIARQFLETAERPALVWLDAFIIADLVRSCSLGEPRPAVLRDAETAALCVLDDVGQEATSLQSVTEELQRIVHVRHGAGLPLIATTGMRADALRARYGAGFERRLTEKRAEPNGLIDLDKLGRERAA